MDYGDDDYYSLPFDVRVAMEERALEDGLALQNPTVSEEDIRLAIDSVPQPTEHLSADTAMEDLTRRMYRLLCKQPCTRYPPPPTRPASRLADFFVC